MRIVVGETLLLGNRKTFNYGDIMVYNYVSYSLKLFIFFGESKFNFCSLIFVLGGILE